MEKNGRRKPLRLSASVIKCLLLMKLTMILICAISLQAIAFDGFGQSKVTLDMENAPLKKVFKAIEKQTPFRFIYNDESLPSKQKVTIAVTDEALNEVVNKVLEKTSLAFKFVGNNLIVISSQSTILQQTTRLPIDITGRVLSESGEPLSGVSILEKGTNNGTTTRADGTFSLSVSGNNASLVFSSVGYETMEIAVGNQKNISVSLNQKVNSQDAVVVVGYGSQRKKDATGAISSVKARDLNTVNAVSIDNLLQGRAAGLNVTTSSAQPGGSLDINIRGALSPRGSNSPLYVIDGLPLTSNNSLDRTSSTGNMRGTVDRSPLTTINPNDIESIDILKDASATSIYGSAAANGVVLITTKKGKEGKTVVNYNSSYGIQSRKDYVEPLNGIQFRSAVNSYGEEFYRFSRRLAPYGNVNPSTVPAYVPFFTSQQVAEAPVGTNYVDYIMRQGRILDQNISVSGGNAQTKIFTSFNFYDQQALLKNSNFKRYSGRLNIDQKIGSKVNLSIGLTYSQVNNDNVAVGPSQDIESPSFIQSALQFAPDIPAFTPTGAINAAYYARTANPESFFRITNKNFTNRLIVTPRLQIDILEGLKLNITGGIDNLSSERSFFVPVDANFTTITEGNAQRGYNKQQNYSAESYLNFDKNFNKSRLSAVAGVGFYSALIDGFGLNAVGFSTGAFGVNNIGIASNKLLSSVNSDRSERSKLSQFTRLNYTLMEKYIFQATGRFDGASNFPKTNQFGFFPSASIGWLINEENFMKNIKNLSQLKLRAGYGASGNESITATGNYGSSLYSLTTTYSYLIGSQLYNSGFIQTQLGNPELKWETDETINLGLDFGLFNNRISGSAEYFVRTANDLLDFRILPSANPIGIQAFNVGSTRSKGFEFTVRTENIVGTNFSWSSLITLGTAKTFWLERNPAVKLAGYIGANDPINAVYGWRTDGIIRSQAEIPVHQTGAFVGNIKYRDLNRDNKLNIDDVTYLGNRDPKGTFGLNNTFNYKGLDLNFFLYGAYGNFTADGFETFRNPGNLVRIGAPFNAATISTDIYTSFNPNGTYPGFANDVAAGSNPTGQNDFRKIANSYFARLKNVTLGYGLPNSLLKSKRILKSARIFIDFQNLGFVTNIRGLDPEMDRNNNPYPTALTTSFGISAQF